MIISQLKDLTRREYEQIRKLVYTESGINLGDQKMELVRSRLGKLLRVRGLASFHDYYQCVVDDPTGETLCEMLDAISTNTTHLFREIRHFTFLRETLKQWATDRAIHGRVRTWRIWSAACSSGEEPHSIAMVAHDAMRADPKVSLKILATDISIQMLRKASYGVYDREQVSNVPPNFRSRYLLRTRCDGEDRFQVTEELRKLITLARFNLMNATFPFKNLFDVIFCRNVMIYFDKGTQGGLVRRFTQHLRLGGYLLIGHSESLHGIDHSLKQVEAATYLKE